jgi:polar amino acid transport system substrate-binding protein
MFARLLRPAAAVIAAALWIATPYPACADLKEILNAGVVRIGVPVDVPPFGFVDERQQPAGLDIELAKLVARQLGVKLEMQQITGANRIPYLMTNKVDLVISALGATPERARLIAFSSPYAALSIGVFGPADAKVASAGEIGGCE